MCDLHIDSHLAVIWVQLSSKRSTCIKAIDMFDVHFKRLFDIQISLQLKMFRRRESCRSISVPSGDIEGGRKATAESTRLSVKVGSANRLPVLRSVIICRSDIELTEEIPRREMTVSDQSSKQKTSKASGPHSNLRWSPATTNDAASGDAVIKDVMKVGM